MEGAEEVQSAGELAEAGGVTRLLWLTLPALHVVGAILEGMLPKVYSAGEVDRAKSK